MAKQKINLPDNDKSRYFALTEFNNYHLNIEFVFPPAINIFFYSFWKASKAICHFYPREIARKRKEWFHLRMSKILFAAKKGTTKCVSRQLLVSIYLQVTCGGLSPKEKNLLWMIISDILMPRMQSVKVSMALSEWRELCIAPLHCRKSSHDFSAILGRIYEK